jgi:hypothetical protein
MSDRITFAEMRDMGVRGILVYCGDFRCSHSIAISGDSWPDDVRLSGAAASDQPANFSLMML